MPATQRALHRGGQRGGQGKVSVRCTQLHEFQGRGGGEGHARPRWGRCCMSALAVEQVHLELSLPHQEGPHTWLRHRYAAIPQVTCIPPVPCACMHALYHRVRDTSLPLRWVAVPCTSTLDPPDSMVPPLPFAYSAQGALHRLSPSRCPLKIIEIGHTLGFWPTNNLFGKYEVKNAVVALFEAHFQKHHRLGSS